MRDKEKEKSREKQIKSCVVFFMTKKAYEISARLVGSEKYIKDSTTAFVSERSKELDSSSSSYSAAGVQIPPNATFCFRAFQLQGIQEYLLENCC